MATLAAGNFVTSFNTGQYLTTLVFTVISRLSSFDSRIHVGTFVRSVLVTRVFVSVER